MIDVQMKQVDDKEMYFIDYEAEHKVSIGQSSIGFFKLKKPKNKFDKVIDLRKLKLIVRRNYHQYRKDIN